LPWKESSPVTERERFIDAYMGREETVAELSRRFGISRKTGYKWITPYMTGTELADRSRKPHRSPNAVAQDMEDFIVAGQRRRGPHTRGVEVVLCSSLGRLLRSSSSRRDGASE